MTSHKSDCATNNAPAIDPAACTCDPVLYTIQMGERSPKYRSVNTYNSMATSWQANFLIEVVKGFCGYWPTEERDAENRQIVRMPATEEVLERATSIVDATINELSRRQWIIRMPSPEELREQDESTVGFMTRGA